MCAYVCSKVCVGNIIKIFHKDILSTVQQNFITRVR